MMVKRAIPINIPNALTILRIVLTPLFAIYLIKRNVGGALWVFGVAALTDALDGLVARLFKQKTTIGAFLDPAADKFLLTTAFVTLAIQGLIPSWLAVIVISRDIVIFFGVALLSIMQRQFRAKPKFLSKMTTVAQLAAVSTVLLSLQVSSAVPFQRPLFWATGAMTITSGFQYIYLGLNILAEQNNGPG